MGEEDGDDHEKGQAMGDGRWAMGNSGYKKASNRCVVHIIFIPVLPFFHLLIES
jgi:hypothetical protein